MKKLWSISTTLRNPERLRSFLAVLREMEGQVWTKKNQINFQIKLIQNRVYGFGKPQFYNGLMQKQIDLVDDTTWPISFQQATEIFNQKQYTDPAMRGRTSYKPLEKIGLANIIDDKINITSLGEYLLGYNYDLGELFFKSFLKWQYPNPVDREFSDGNIYNLKPFLATLHLINKVNKICKEKNIKEKGISRLEFELFALTLINYKDITTQAKKLIKFRLALLKITTHKDKNDFISNYKEELSLKFSNVYNSRDYVDNAIWYFRMTRYIYIRGGGYYVDLEPRRMVEINSLLNTYDGGCETLSKKEYTEYISNIDLPILPWETKEKLTEIYNKLAQDVNNLEFELEQNSSVFEAITNISDLKNTIENIREYRTKLQNLILKNELTEISKIDEVVKNLTNIRKSADLKPSIALEKYITIALNIINDAKNIQANAKVGDDNEFIFTAPSNKPDIECYYDSFNSICEVTMLIGRDQWHNEGQPVMRHFRDFEIKSNQKQNYCLFVAPKIHRDTINTYWTSTKYEYEGAKQKIVPFTINQIIEILKIIKDIRNNSNDITNLQFKQLLDDIVNITNKSTKSDDWLRKIPECIVEWKDNIESVAT
ncbi:MAG: AlwI family type II restriction endonuclease [Gammaproteobacteria bacterium]|nr:MAG: AlwI family type II restriction endonuclease [Gammaproteobacteria bacterium]